jgi:hypothetical protein
MMLLFVLFALANAQNSTNTTISAISTSEPFDPNSHMMGFVYFMGAFAILASCAGIYEALKYDCCIRPQKPVVDLTSPV